MSGRKRNNEKRQIQDHNVLIVLKTNLKRNKKQPRPCLFHFRALAMSRDAFANHFHHSFLHFGGLNALHWPDTQGKPGSIPGGDTWGTHDLARRNRGNNAKMKTPGGAGWPLMFIIIMIIIIIIIIIMRTFPVVFPETAGFFMLVFCVALKKILKKNENPRPRWFSIYFYFCQFWPQEMIETVSTS